MFSDRVPSMGYDEGYSEPSGNYDNNYEGPYIPHWHFDGCGDSRVRVPPHGPPGPDADTRTP